MMFYNLDAFINVDFCKYINMEFTVNALYHSSERIRRMKSNHYGLEQSERLLALRNLVSSKPVNQLLH